MGYYSEVGLVLTKKGFEQLEAALTAVEDKELRNEIEDLLSSADSQHTAPNGDHLWTWEWMKWYPEFREIGWLETCLKAMPDEDFYFLRIGEEHDDVFISGDCWDNTFKMGLSRSIYFDVPLSDENSVETALHQTAA